MLGRLVRGRVLGVKALRRPHLAPVALLRRYSVNEPSSRHPLVPPGPDLRFVEPKELDLPELPPEEDFDEQDTRYDVILTSPLIINQPQKLQDWTQKQDSQKSWRQRWRDRWRRNCPFPSSFIPIFSIKFQFYMPFHVLICALVDSVRGWATDPYPEPLRFPVLKYEFPLLLFHILYWGTLPVITCIWLVLSYVEDVKDYIPFTGRPRVNAMSPEWIMPIAEATTKGVIADHGYDVVSHDDARAQLVQRIFARILMANGLEDKLDWSITMLEVNMPHVYGNPNGQLIVCAGMLPVALTEDGIAHLLSHEIAHIILGHHVETWSKESTWPTVLRAVSKMSSSSVNHESFIWRYAARRNSELMHSWLAESEADELGLQLMARACFSPSIVPGLSDRLYRLSAERGPYFEVHPVHDSKQEELQKYLKTALDVRQKCNCPPERTYRVAGNP